MKYIFEHKDVQPGLKVTRSQIQEVWIVGYRVDLDKPSRLVLVSMLDGMVSNPSSPNELAMSLTEGLYEPYFGTVPKE